MIKRAAWGLALVFLAGLGGLAAAQEVFRQTGALRSGDRDAGDGRLVDWHRFALAAGARYLVEVLGDDLDPALILRFPEAGGADLENDDRDGWNAGIVYASGRSEVVEIGATSSSAGQTGEYTVVVRRIAPARSIQSGQTVTGTLGGDADTGVDSYVLSGTRGERVRVLLSSAAFDPVLRLQSRGGHAEENDDFGETPDSALSYLFLDPGPLEIQVRATGGGGGPYELRVDRGPAARLLEPGRTQTGRLSDDTEEYLLEGRRGDAVVIRAESSDFDTVLTVTDRQGRRAQNDDQGGGTDSQVHYRFAADGPVAVSVSRLDPGEPAPYRVWTRSSPERAAAFDPPPAALEDGATYRAYLGVHGRRLAGKYGQRFTFEAAAGEVVTLEMASEDMDVYLEVRSPDGSTFEDDDSGGGYDARLLLICPVDGTYAVTATTATEWAVGFYEIGLVRGGQATSLLDSEGMLERRDQRDPSGRYYDAVSLVLEEGQSATVELSSEDFDAYLYVWPPDGEEILSDDDGGGGTTARLQIRQAAGGRWTVYATSSSSGETGSYRLRVSGH